MTIVDAWIQHPTSRFLRSPMLESLRRWGTVDVPDELPVAHTLEALRVAGVSHALVSAWVGPGGPLISNDEVAAIVREAPGTLTGIASASLTRPMDGVREL